MDYVFPERLKETRLAQGMTQKQLAEKAQVATASYASYEKGTKKPPVDTAQRIAGVLNVSLDWLCGHSPSKEVMKFKTFADVMMMFITLDATGLRISMDTDEIIADGDEALGIKDLEMIYQAHYESYEGEEPPTGTAPMSLRAVFRISDGRLAKFFEKWFVIRKQYRKEIIDRELYDLWLEKQISEAQAIPLPLIDKQSSPQN